jgi:hypothetical protein
MHTHSWHGSILIDMADPAEIIYYDWAQTQCARGLALDGTEVNSPEIRQISATLATVVCDPGWAL